MFMQYGMGFFISHRKLWCKDLKGQHKQVIRKDHCLFLIRAAHNDVGHHGVYATNALISEQYWWPHMAQDIAWFVLTCHIHMSDKENLQNSYSADCCYASSTILKGLHGYHAYASGKWIQVYRARPVFAYSLSGMDSIKEGICQSYWTMDIAQYYLSMGMLTLDSHG